MGGQEEIIQTIRWLRGEREGEVDYFLSLRVYHSVQLIFLYFFHYAKVVCCSTLRVVRLSLFQCEPSEANHGTPTSDKDHSFDFLDEPPPQFPHVESVELHPDNSCGLESEAAAPRATNKHAEKNNCDRGLSALKYRRLCNTCVQAPVDAAGAIGGPASRTPPTFTTPAQGQVSAHNRFVALFGALYVHH